ncbi:ATPase (plasmid) [Pseudorhodobacter turbinis]|uniref:ATPase n=1 Tax=Pseudorhodobacter turbinis TaxID=2500533 RepID=A0A4V1E174_9RHOB|nr:ATPase [Pseudorhodobacter turbinis]QCO57144.1 ATPase [Pseudorhodobacter turbinis]
MIYQSSQDWMQDSTKRVLLFGMSGLGKTHLSNMLRDDAGWFHYSIDYRIGTRYMGEYIADNLKRAAMDVPLLRELLLSDSIHILSNITFENLAPLSTYLGKPGNPALGGVAFDEYCARQMQHQEAEKAALLDTESFIHRARELYGYSNFVCDSGGSICEVVDAADPNDPILSALSRNLLLVWIEGTDAHRDALIARFDRAPKPMYYQPEFLLRVWNDYLAEQNVTEDRVNPDAFLRYGYARLLDHRRPRYRAMANWGISVTADEVASVKSPADFDALIATALDRKTT